MRVSLMIAAFALVPVLSSCGGSDSRSPDSATATGTPKVMVPTIAAKAETPLAQQKGETSATLAAEPCKLKVTQKKDEKSASGIGSEVAGKYRYTVTTTDVAEFEPDEFQVLIALKNLGKHAMDYADAVQFEYLIDGKPVSFSKAEEGVSMHNVPAGGTAFIRISGPKIESLKDGQQAVLTLHNLTVKGEGKTAERANLSWQFAIKPERTVDLKTVTTTEWR